MAVPDKGTANFTCVPLASCVSINSAGRIRRCAPTRGARRTDRRIGITGRGIATVGWRLILILILVGREPRTARVVLALLVPQEPLELRVHVACGVLERQEV